MSNVKLQSLMSRQLPEFVREDFPVFVDFLKAYYEYLENIDARDLEDIRDISKTALDYIVYFSNELAYANVPSTSQIDPVLYLRKSKQLFTSKGTEDSFKFLFKLLFNKNVDISYPWDSVLKVSDGKWKQDTSIFVTLNSGNINDLPGNQILISNQATAIKVFVDRVVKLRSNIYEIFIDKNFYGNISIGDSVIFGNINATIIPTASSYVIEQPGKGYSVGDLFTATSVAGGNTITHLLKVTRIDSNGGIVKLVPVNFNAGYSDDFFVLSNKTDSIINSKVNITKNSTALPSFPDDTLVSNYLESGVIINPNYWQLDYGTPFYAGNILREFYVNTANSQNVTSDFSLVRFTLGAVARYQGYYISNDGFLDDSIKLQDSKYYQKYSYLLTVDEKLDAYKSYVKSFVHTAGMALYSEFQIKNTYDPEVGATQTLEFTTLTP